MRFARIRAEFIATAVALASLLSGTSLLQGCAGPTTRITPLAEPTPISDERYEKALKLLAAEPDRIVQTASKYALESATLQELAGLSCLAHSNIARAWSHGEPSDTLRSFLGGLIATLAKGEATCESISDQWYVEFFSYSSYKTRRVPEQPSREPSELEMAIGEGVASGIWPLFAAPLFLSCVGTVGLVCPILGETVAVELRTSTLPQNGQHVALRGVGVARGAMKISAWSALNPDADALGLAFAEALKELASSYAAVMTTEAAGPPKPVTEETRALPPQSTDDFVNCMSGGKRRWVNRSGCD